MTGTQIVELRGYIEATEGHDILRFVAVKFDDQACHSSKTSTKTGQRLRSKPYDSQYAPGR